MVDYDSRVVSLMVCEGMHADRTLPTRKSVKETAFDVEDHVLVVLG